MIMATTTSDLLSPAEGNAGNRPFYLKDMNTYLAGFVIMLAVYSGIRIYQQLFSFSTGLDSTVPIFATYWYNMLYIELALEAVFAVGLFWYLWATRDKHLDAISPKTEIQRYFTLVMWLGVYAFGVYWAGSYFAEQDNAWHQVAIRDTPFTPNHIVVFYLCFPVYCILGIATWIYARTRIPHFAKGVSLPLTLAVVGPFMLLPGIGFNEWGHTFWFREELFASPVHYWFVVAVWFAHGLGGILMQSVNRINEILDQMGMDADVSKPINEG
jgi:methane/ammonia monooxygenase subunit C